MPGRYKVYPLSQATLALTLALAATTVSNAAVSLQSIHGDRPGVIDLGLAKPAGALDPAKRLGLTVTLPLTNKADLDKFVANVSDPRSSLYGQYLTPAEFASKYGASQTGYAAVIAWAKANGLTVTKTSTSRFSLSLSGTVAQVQAAFGVQLKDYVDAAGRKFFAASTSPKMPSSVARYVSSVHGLSSFAPGHPMNVYLPPAKRAEMLTERSLTADLSGTVNPIRSTESAGGSGHGGAFSPKDLNAAYQMPQLASSGKGQSIGFYAEGGIYASDAGVYESYYHLPKTPVIPVSVAGTDTTTPIGGIATEASLDMDMELAMAPDVTAIYCYEADTESTFSGSLVDALTAVADDDKVSAFNISYGVDEALQFSDSGMSAFGDENTALENCAAEGITVYASSGDLGAYGDLGAFFYPESYNVSDPASEPLITGVGGTTMFFENGKDLLEETWGALPVVGATGGGISGIWSLPSYQTFADGTPLVAYNGGSSTARNVPDIAAVADPLTGVDVYTTDNYYINTPGWIDIGGTSASAPIWTGFTAVLNQQRADAGMPKIGFANPLLYGLYSAATDGSDYAATTYDFDEVSVGSNGNVNAYGNPGYAAGDGYDNDTGLGSLSGSILMQDSLVLPADIDGATGTPANAPSNFAVTATTPTTVSFSWHPVRNAKGYVISDIASDNYYAYTTYPELLKTTTHPRGTVTGLKPKTTYTFILAAVSPSGGNYDNNDEITVTTPAK